ncbi:MAG TPA: hypothetical protein VFG96_11030 [Jiangellaceae bacterium]|nr:hypothetical protein [Jiangellaceae bacterium]
MDGQVPVPTSSKPTSGRTSSAVDLVAGTAVIGAEVAAGMAGAVVGTLEAVGHFLGRPVAGLARTVGAPVGTRIGRAADRIADRGRAERRRAEADLVRLLDALVPEVVRSVVTRIDLTAIVRQQVDLDEVAAEIDVDAIARRLDVDAVIARVDLIGITEDLLDRIDLPEIIRESAGSITTEAVHDVRMTGIGADEAVNRAIDRLLRRRGTRRTVGPAQRADGFAQPVVHDPTEDPPR